MSVSFSAGAGLIIIGIFVFFLSIPGGAEIVGELLGRQVKSVWRKSTKYFLFFTGLFLVLIGLFITLREANIPMFGINETPLPATETVQAFETSTFTAIIPNESKTPTPTFTSPISTKTTTSTLSIIVANPTSEFVPGAKVTYQTKFDDIVNWNMFGSADINDNMLVLKENAGAAHRTSLSIGDGILVLFRFSSGTNADIVLDDPNSGGGNYIGIKITPAHEFEVALGYNNAWMGGQLLNGTLNLTTGDWYYGLIEIKDEGKFYLKIWNKDNPNLFAEKTLPMGTVWKNTSWNGTIWSVDGSGQIEIANYQEIRFNGK